MGSAQFYHPSEYGPQHSERRSEASSQKSAAAKGSFLERVEGGNQEEAAHMESLNEKATKIQAVFRGR